MSAFTRIACIGVVAIAVVAAIAAPPAHSVRVATSVSATRVYVGQRVTVSYTLERGTGPVPEPAPEPDTEPVPGSRTGPVPELVPETDAVLPPIRDLQLVAAPRFEGFWASEIDADTTPSAPSGAPRIRLQTFRLFPLRAGTLRVEPPTYSMVVYPESVDEIDSKPASIRASADSATVTVLPLPAQGQPDTFTGAVGRFRVEAESDASNVPVGDVATIDVTVRGDGNLETTGAPVLEPVPGLRIASPRRTNVNLDLSSTTAVGSATWAIDVIPQTEGRHALGPVRLDYFDPSTERYAVAQSGRLEINAGPRPIAPQTAASPSPTSTTWYGWLAAAVGLALFGACAWLVWNYRREDHSSTNHNN